MGTLKMLGTTTNSQAPKLPPQVTYLWGQWGADLCPSVPSKLCVWGCSKALNVLTVLSFPTVPRLTFNFQVLLGQSRRTSVINLFAIALWLGGGQRHFWRWHQLL